MLMTRFRRKAIMVERDIAMTELAREVGVDVATVSRIVAGVTKRDTAKARRVKEALAKRVGVSVDELWPTQAA